MFQTTTFFSTKTMSNEEKDREFLIKEVIEFGEWMTDSAGHGLEDSIEDLAESGGGGYYEVIVDIHLKNGDCITVRNNCKYSYLRRQYMGDTIEYYKDSESKQQGFLINYMKNGVYHQSRIPVSSICWAEGHTEDVNWKRLRSDIETIKEEDYGLPKVQNGQGTRGYCATCSTAALYSTDDLGRGGNR